MKTIYLLLPLALLGADIDKNILKKLKSDICVVNFFASWCHSCKKELPLIQKLSKRVCVVGVDIDEDILNAKNFQKKLNLTFPIINDYNQKIVSSFNPLAIPAIYIIKNKKIAAKIIGAKNNIDQLILKKIEEIK